MRHKYTTSAIVLSWAPLSEASALVTLLTPEVGLIRARAQGVRKPGAKMASALQTWVESDVMLLRGKDGWRLAGALQIHNWFGTLSQTARLRVGRIANLLIRLVHDEASDTSTTFYTIFFQLLSSLTEIHGTEEESDAAECLAALRILHTLGVDAGTVPGGLTGGYTAELLEEITAERSDFILRINRGIAASGL